MQPVQDINVRNTVPLITPRRLHDELPLTPAAVRTVLEARRAIQAILDGRDTRLMVVVGPCSIHDEAAGLEYARRLRALSDRVGDRLMLVMRVYFEKPRTTVGWKGLINDPHLDDSFDIDAGLRIARRILLTVAELGLPAATEMLDPITPQYLADLIAWAAIGARTTESPTHRQMASGLSMPVGYKNATDGNVQIAIEAMQAALHAHSFVGIDADGGTCIVNTRGNPWGHLILRGGRSGPNYAPESLAVVVDQLTKVGLRPRVMVDCSHANSNKDYRRQSIAWNDVVAQRAGGNANILGLMLESNLNPGNQPVSRDRAALKYGVSITDPCIGWDETESLILAAHDRLAAVAGAHK